MPRRQRSEGSVYQEHRHPTCPPAVDGVRPAHRCKGRWVGMLDLGWRDGVRRRKAVYGATQDEAVKALNAAKLALSQNGDLALGSPTVEKWMRHWLDEIASDRVRNTTLPGYRSKVEQYIIPAIGRVRLEKLTPEHLDRMYAGMRKRKPKPLSDATILQTHRILSRALKVAHRYNKVTRNVAELVDAPPVPKNRRTGLTGTEVAAVTEAAAGLPLESRWLAAVILGMRQGECLGLGWDAVDLADGTITVRRTLARVKGLGLVMGEPKSEDSKRTFPVPEFILDSLRAHRDAQPNHPQGLVWCREDGRPIDPHDDWEGWKALLEKAQVADYHLHDARHSAATALILLGVPLPTVAQILGHSDIKMTYRYVDPDRDAMKAAMQLVQAAHRPALGS